MRAGSTYAHAVAVARDGSRLISGQTGVKVRGALDSLSTSLIDNVSMPCVMINTGTDSLDLARVAGIDHQGHLRVADSGTQFHVVLNTSGAIPGSVRANTTTVSTASGLATPKYRCDVPMTVGMKDGTTRTVIRRDAMVIENCAHELISLGNLAKDEGIKTVIGSDSETELVFSDGAASPAFNLGIIVLPYAGGDWSTRATPSSG
jgi:hypothetical protein